MSCSLICSPTWLRSVPPMIVAVVMVLQRLEGCSDREAVDRFCFDARWKYVARGGSDFDYPGFVHTVLVDMRARLARSQAPGRIFEVVLRVAREAGLLGRRRVLDSTPIYDAVATMDTLTLVRSAIRGPRARTLRSRSEPFRSPPQRARMRSRRERSNGRNSARGCRRSVRGHGVAGGEASFRVSATTLRYAVTESR